MFCAYMSKTKSASAAIKTSGVSAILLIVTAVAKSYEMSSTITTDNHCVWNEALIKLLLVGIEYYVASLTMLEDIN